MAEGQTILLIISRLYSVRHVDEQLPRHGRVTEHGSFDDLMRHDGGGPENFRSMPLMQSEQYRLDGCTLPAQNRQKGESAVKLGEAH
ncbi:hypothetical protein [Streptomyces sp. NPDC020607]|uniref:hypothetical protein n=1 Tax=Streptomyces sp. NPDC020607 TaxID=3365082 RepID=UPI0037A06353